MKRWLWTVSLVAGVAACSSKDGLLQSPDAGTPAGDDSFDAGSKSGSQPDGGISAGAADGGVGASPGSCPDSGDPTAFDPFTGGLAEVHERSMGDGWYQMNAPLGTRLTALYGFNDDDVWVVGTSPAAALHFDGHLFHSVAVPEVPLLAIWGAAPNDVWAVGGRIALHWDGRQWAPVDTGVDAIFSSVHGTASDDVWAVGPTVALHFDGQQWRPSPTFVGEGPDVLASLGAMPTAVFAISRNDVVTARLGCQRWDGARWSPTDCKGGGNRATAIWASGSDDVWIVGYSTNGVPGYEFTTRSHWDGQTWTHQATDGDHPVVSVGGSSIFGFARDDVWIDGWLHFDGKGWTPACLGGRQTPWGTPSGHLFGLSNSVVTRRDDAGWATLANLQGGTAGAGGTREDDLYILSKYGGVIRYDGQGFKTVLSSSGSEVLPGAFGSGAADIWANGLRGLIHFDGAHWSAPLLGRLEAALTGWSRSPDDAIVTRDGAPGTRGAWHWDGNRWEPLSIDFDGQPPTRFWGDRPGNVWAAAGGSSWDQISALWHWDGTAWTRAWAMDGWGHIEWLFGADGVPWLIAPADTPGEMKVLRWSGMGLVESTTVPGNYAQLAGPAPDDIWLAAGGLVNDGNARLYHYDGSSWSRTSTVLPNNAGLMWSVESGPTLVVGTRGDIYLRRN